MNKLSTFGSYTLLCIASLTIMVGALVAPGQLSIANALGVADHAILLMTLPALGAVLFAPIAGKIIDRYGAYCSLILGLFLYGLLGIAVYWLHGAVAVFTNRLLLGGVTAIVMAGCSVLISQWYVGPARLGMMAKQGMAIELGGVIFLFVGGLFAAHYWALPLTLYLCAWVFLAMLLVFVPRNHPAEVADDVEITETQGVTQQGLSLKSVYGVTVLSMSAFFSAIVLLPTTLHSQQYNEQQTGFLLAFISLVAVVAAHFMPKFIKLFSEQKVLVIAFSSFALAYVCYLQTGTPILVAGAIFSGLGFGLSIPLLNHMTVERSPANVRGRNLSYYTMAVFSGQFLTSFSEYIPGGEQNVYMSCIGLSVIVAITLLLNNKRVKCAANGV